MGEMNPSRTGGLKMGRPLRIEYPGAFYHVTSRGNEQKDIFKSEADSEKFLTYLGSAAERYGAVFQKKPPRGAYAFD